MFGMPTLAVNPFFWESPGVSPTSKLKSKFTVVITTLMISFTLAFSGPVIAEIILYGTSTGFGSGGGQGGSGGPGSGTGGGNVSQFHRIDIATGMTTEISMDIGYGGDVGGLATDLNNVLFAGTGGRGPNSLGRGTSPTMLFTIDPVTGLGSPAIGPLGIEFGPGMGSLSTGDFDQFGSLRQSISGWSFDPISGDLYGMTGRGSQLFTADTTTGLATRIGTPCVPDPSRCRRGNAIAFDDVGVNNPLGTLFWANDVEIAELDPTSGLIIGSPVGLDFTPFGPPANQDAGFRVVAMDYHPLTGELYAAVQQGGADVSPPAKSTIAILDPLGVILYGTSTGFGSGGGQGGSGGPGSGTGGGNVSQFHRIDIATGMTTEISMDIGYGGDVGGLATDLNNVLFAGTGGRGPNSLGRGTSPTMLFTIDPVTGLGSPAIGPLGIEFGPGMGSLSTGDFDQFGSLRQSISGWSFDPISGDLYGMTGRGSQLFTADTTTGLATRIGTPCVPDPSRCRRGNAIAFDDVGVNNPLGTLFWANDVEIAELDPTSGLIIGSPVGLDFTPFGPPANQDAGFRVVAMDYHPLTGELYAAVQQGGADVSPPAKSTIAILDPLAGIFTIVGEIDSTGVKLDGIAFATAGTFTIIGDIDSTGVKLDGVAFTHPPTIVNIDVEPKDEENEIKPRKDHGKVRVAILTQGVFDAVQVDPGTVRFGPDGATAVKFKVKDVDGDSDADLVFRFKILETGIACGDHQATLIGKTLSGQNITGSDTIKTIDCKDDDDDDDDDD